MGDIILEIIGEVNVVQGRNGKAYVTLSPDGWDQCRQSPYAVTQLRIGFDIDSGSLAGVPYYTRRFQLTPYLVHVQNSEQGDMPHPEGGYSILGE